MELDLHQNQITGFLVDGQTSQKNMVKVWKGGTSSATNIHAWKLHVFGRDYH